MAGGAITRRDLHELVDAHRHANHREGDEDVDEKGGLVEVPVLGRRVLAEVGRRVVGIGGGVEGIKGPFHREAAAVIGLGKRVRDHVGPPHKHHRDDEDE